MKIEKGRRVRVRVELAVKGGDPIEKNVVEYFQGAGTMLPGLEKVLEGLEKGAVKKGTLTAATAFGDPRFHVEKPIARTEFPKDAKLEVGQQFMAKGPDGKSDVVLRIEKVDDKQVNCVILHPLADKDISYEVEVLAVTDPAPPPLPAHLVAKDE